MTTKTRCGDEGGGPLAVAGAALLLGVCVALLACADRDEEKAPLEYGAPAAHGEATKPASTPVAATKDPGPSASKEELKLRLTGSLAADEKAAVAANTDGIVSEVPIERGTLLKRGDLLAHLDPRDKENSLAEGQAAAEELRVQLGLKSANEPFDVAARPEVKRAKAALELQESTHRRNTSLVTRGGISQQDVERSANEVVAARESYELALAEGERLYKSYESALIRLRSLKKAVEDTTITAPFQGVVAEKQVSVGEHLARGGSVATLMRIDPLRLELTVSERDVARIETGQQVSFSVSAFPGETFSATVVRLSPNLDTSTRSLTVECSAANPDLRLRPGMFATATVTTNDATTAADPSEETHIAAE